MPEELLQIYSQRKDEIKKRLQEFKEILEDTNERIFAELAFCLCTPLSKATVCWRAIESLNKNNLLFIGTENQIQPFLNAIFRNKDKARYIIEARKFFTENSKIQIKNNLKMLSNNIERREWLVKNINGFGMKEASHFLRNIGMSNDLAILDSHILKNLYEYGIIDKPIKNPSPKKYLEIENKMKKFSENVGIPFDELDLLLWSKETGMVFK